MDVVFSVRNVTIFTSVYVQKLRLRIEDPPRRKHMVYLGGAVLAGIMKVIYFSHSVIYLSVIISKALGQSRKVNRKGAQKMKSCITVCALSHGNLLILLYYFADGCSPSRMHLNSGLQGRNTRKKALRA